MKNDMMAGRAFQPIPVALRASVDYTRSMSPAPTPMRIPETMGPSEIGPYFRELRLYFKLSPQDVSERLHIRVRYVTAMEEGRFDQMPGLVYARGYVQTYAEFLGLDADQVVDQCFPGMQKDTPVSQVVKFAPLPGTQGKAKPANRWRWIALAGVAVLAVFLMVQDGSEEEESGTVTESTVADVPESMLAGIRDRVMPRAVNYACLTESYALSCMMATAEYRRLIALSQAPTLAGHLANIVVVVEEDTPLAPVSEQDSATDLPNAVKLQHDAIGHE